MVSEVHKIRSKKLQPLVQYILYNRHDQDTEHSVTSYPNTNICLGISNGHALREVDDGFVGQAKEDKDLFVYTTGLYTSPHKFEVCKNWDEICIDFHPLGYYHFFNTPSKPKIVDAAFVNV
ncbi:MAG: DUF6597 domain-containing transcriptional factor, partial [Bacteroidota bacterium]